MSVYIYVAVKVDCSMPNLPRVIRPGHLVPAMKEDRLLDLCHLIGSQNIGFSNGHNDDKDLDITGKCLITLPCVATLDK